MARERHLKTIDISNVPELRRIVKQLWAAKEPLVLQEENRDVAIVRPVNPPKKRITRGRPTSNEDPLWKLVGIGASEGPGDVSTNKHKYLADAYSELHK